MSQYSTQKTIYTMVKEPLFYLIKCLHLQKRKKDLSVVLYLTRTKPKHIQTLNPIPST